MCRRDEWQKERKELDLGLCGINLAGEMKYAKLLESYEEIYRDGRPQQTFGVKFTGCWESKIGGCREEYVVHCNRNERSR